MHTKKNEVQKSIKKNTVYNAIKNVTSLFFPLITFPYISRVLQPDNLGKINFGNSIISYFSLIASLGISTYAIRECAKLKNNRNELSSLSSELFSINILTTFFSYIFLAITLIFASPLSEYKLLIIVQSSSILFTTLGAEWLNMAMEDFKYITVRTICSHLLSVVLILLFVRDPDDYINYAIISVASSGMANIANMICRRKYCKTKFVIHLNLKTHLKPILILFSTLLAQTIYLNTDITLLGFLCGDYEVGLYSTSVKIYQIANTLVTSVTIVIIPRISIYFNLKNYEKINDLIKSTLNFIIVFGLPVIVGINCVAPELIEIFAGSQYIGAVSSLRVLTIALPFSAIANVIANVILIPTGKEKNVLASCSFGALFNFLGNLFLIPHLGVIAAAVTTALSELIVVILTSRFINNQIKVENKLKMLISPIIGCLGIIGVTCVCNLLLSSLFIKFISIVVSSILIYGSILVVLKNEFVIKNLTPLIQKIFKPNSLK